jgi:hypothetical protein
LGLVLRAGGAQSVEAVFVVVDLTGLKRGVYAVVLRTREPKGKVVRVYSVCGAGNVTRFNVA